MTDFRGNIDHWIRRVEPNYFMFFVRAWIPFNAWYVAERPQLNKSDRKIIKDLQDHPDSKVRKVIETFLRNNDRGALNFQYHLGELHSALERKALFHNGVQLSFTNLLLSQNPKKFEKDTDKEGNVYKAENLTSYFQVLAVDKSGKSFLDYKKSPFDVDDLKKDVDFIKIADRRIQDRIVRCFEAINPDRPINLVTSSKVKGDYLSLESDDPVRFINDPTTIAKATIKVLYAIRCMLFHGEIEPTPPQAPVYEHAYNVLRLILKELQ